MAGKSVNTNVVLGGSITQGFLEIERKIAAVAPVIEQISSVMRDFEVESAGVYRSYEDNMLAAKYALSSQYESASELDKAMKILDSYASDWAATSIFHTSDVSEAINEAAHAGWSLEEILIGIPQAMLIAQAGGMDLSQGLDYLVKMMGATNSQFDEMDVIINQWSKSANMSATNIGEMGQAFESMGAAAQFGESTQELFTLLAVLANVGTVGSEAGTALRGAMMRIIAPTVKAQDAMSLLGADAEEIDEILANTSVTKAAKMLKDLGFSAYDADGNLLPIIDVFKNLEAALRGVNEEAQYEILTAIFPTRTIATAKAFLAAIGNGQMEALYNGIGDSEGYAAKGAEIMMSGMTGAVETLLSKWEEFKRSTGEALAPSITNAADALGDIVDYINGLDETQLNALVGGMTALAATGPLLMGVHGVASFFAMLGPVGGTILGVSVAAGILYGHFSKLNEIRFHDHFGEMGLDLDELGKHVDSVKTSFDGQAAAIAEWETALNSAEETYSQASSSMAEAAMTDVLTGKTLTDADISNLYGYAQSVYDAVWDGLENAEKSDLTLLDTIFGDGESAEQMEVGNTAEQVVTSWYNDLYGQANEIGLELRNQMTAALQDKELDEAERLAIQASLDRYNQIMAQINAQMDSEAYYAQLSKAQRVSWDTVEEYISENSAKKEEDLKAIDDLYDRKYGHYAAAYRYAIDNGLEVETLSGEMRKVSEEDLIALGEQIEAERQAAMQGVSDKYDQYSMAAFDALMNDSDYADAWNLLREKISINADGSLNTSDMFAGMSLDEINEAFNQLNALWYDAGRIKNKLPDDFANSELGRQMVNLMYYAQYAADDAMKIIQSPYWSVFDTYPMQEDMYPYIEQYDIEQTIKSKKGEQEKLSSEIAETQRRMSELDYGFWDWLDHRGYKRDYATLYGEDGQGGGLLDEKAKVDLDLENANKELEELKEKIGQEQTMTVILDVDDSALTSYRPAPMLKLTTTRPPSGGIAAYAEGGRATEASIFGDDGAEWAIPEAHTERTAELLNAARQASGFTWGDLLARYGGLNANPGNQSVVVHYSPTINAQDARGVASALAEDKDRLMQMVRKMLEEQRLRDEVEVYA